MSNNLKLEVLLKAVDQATRPFKAIQTASKSLSGDIRMTQQSLRDLNGQASKIDGFRKTSAQLAVTGQALEKAKQLLPLGLQPVHWEVDYLSAIVRFTNVPRSMAILKWRA